MTKQAKNTVTNNKVNPEQKFSLTKNEAAYKASLTPAQQADFEQDAKDARLEMWLAEHGRYEESNQVYERRMARAARRGDFGHPGIFGPAFAEGQADKNAAAHAAFKAAWDEELRRERASKEEAITGIFGAEAGEDYRAARQTERAHADRMMAHAEAEVFQAPAEALTVPGPKVFDGTYTIISPKGEHRTLRIRRQKLDASFKPGVSLVGLLTGADNENSYTNFGHVQDDGSLRVWAKHENTNTAKIGVVLFALLKMDAAGQRFAAAGYSVEVSKRCYRCHRVLTHPQSLATGIGPECASK